MAAQRRRAPAAVVDETALVLPPLMEWITEVSPHLQSPTHLPEWCSMLERAAQRLSVRGLCAVPIRHYKTVTAMHGIAWALLQDPTLRIIYLTHTQLYANTRGREIRDLCRRVGVEIQEGHSTIHEWRTTSGGGVLTMSSTASALGQDVDILVCDDPFDGPEAADDPNIRHRIDETIAFYTARLSRGGSCIIVMSRFHPDDAIGRRLRRTSEIWEYVHQEALIDEGKETERAFAPLVKTVAELKKIREALREVDPRERVWWSQFQNQPKADSGDLFHGPTRYGSLPTEPGWRDVIGIDLAYSQSRRADFFALVLMRIWGSTAYVRMVSRLRADLAVLEMEIRRAWTVNGTRCPIFSYVSGPEKGAILYFVEHGVPINGMHARYNKLVRAQKTIDFWNDKRVLIPEGADFDPFLNRVAAFRGLEVDDDDEVDALVSAVDGAMWSGGQTPTRTLGQRRI
jgi:hypothetical protein